jgi:hypothetical protein
MQRALPALFAFGDPDWAKAPAPAPDDDPAPTLTGEAAAVRVLYQTPPKAARRPSRGSPVRRWLASVIETLFPRPLVPAPAGARVRR